MHLLKYRLIVYSVNLLVSPCGFQRRPCKVLMLNRQYPTPQNAAAPSLCSFHCTMAIPLDHVPVVQLPDSGQKLVVEPQPSFSRAGKPHAPSLSYHRCNNSSLVNLVDLHE